MAEDDLRVISTVAMSQWILACLLSAGSNMSKRIVSIA
jgi:hypothetical protein